MFTTLYDFHNPILSAEPSCHLTPSAVSTSHERKCVYKNYKPRKAIMNLCRVKCCFFLFLYFFGFLFILFCVWSELYFLLLLDALAWYLLQNDRNITLKLLVIISDWFFKLFFIYLTATREKKIFLFILYTMFVYCKTSRESSTKNCSCNIVVE